MHTQRQLDQGSHVNSLSGIERQAIMALARAASLEMTVHDAAQLRAASALRFDRLVRRETVF